MTINVGVASPDGVVLASDSRTTRTDEYGHRILSDSTQKVFAIDERFGVAASGFAFIADDTIAGVMDRFLAQSAELEDIDAFSEGLGRFFDERFGEWMGDVGETWDPEERAPAITFLVSGYDPEGVGHVYEVGVPGPVHSSSLADTIAGGVIWRGQTDVIGRLIKGVDWLGLFTSEIDVSEELKEALQGLEYRALEPITIQDAIDYADVLIRTTVDMQRFSDGTFAHPGLIPGCGGPVQSLVIERRGTVWKQPPTRLPSPSTF
jgi:Proteasome subunit